jgi:TetR/AcrR family transcriptional regulator, regulator of biofilm formation and stress response
LGVESKPDGRLARGAARRGRLLNAAVRIVSDSGSGSLTHRAVAEEAQVSIASVTYHFPSIGDLRRETLEYAGSRVGLKLADLVSDTADRVDNIPQICADYAVHLVTEQRMDTAAVFELIVAAGHDEELRPLVAVYNGLLANLLAPYAGDRATAMTVGAAIQGLLIVQLASAFPADTAEFRAAVADLIHRYRAIGPASADRADPSSVISRKR